MDRNADKNHAKTLTSTRSWTVSIFSFFPERKFDCEKLIHAILTEN